MQAAQSVVSEHVSGLSTLAGTHAHRDATPAIAAHERPGIEGFAIHTARSQHRWQEAGRLVHHRYSQRGYRRDALHQDGPAERPDNLVTLSAIGPEGTIGTLGIRFDTGRGLNADGAFAKEMADLRAQGRSICEFTQLALDNEAASKTVLAALFHTAYLHAHKVNGIALLVIEVNPRHVPYYRRMLGFKICSEVRTNTHVQAPAVLMSLELSHAAEQIARYGGNPHMCSMVRSLYPLFFSPQREGEILAQMSEERRLAA